MNLNDTPRGGTLCLSKAGVGIGSTASQVKIAAPNGAGVDFAIDGILYHKADAATIAMDPKDEDGTTITTQAVSTVCLYLLCLKADGSLRTFKGQEVATSEYEAGTAQLKWPEKGATPEDYCEIGAVLVETSASVTFTAGTTELSAAGITDTYFDLFARPPHPKTYA